MVTLSQIKQKLLFKITLLLVPCRLQYLSVATSAVLGTMISWVGFGLRLPPLHEAVCCCFGWEF